MHGTRTVNAIQQGKLTYQGRNNSGEGRGCCEKLFIGCISVLHTGKSYQTEVSHTLNSRGKIVKFLVFSGKRN